MKGAQLSDVVITGVGVVSPLGQTPGELVRRLLAHETAVGPLDRFDPGPLPCHAAAVVKGFNAKAWVDNRKNLKIMTPAVQYGLAAVKMAAADASISADTLAPERFGVFVGAGHAFGETRDLWPALEAGVDDQGRYDARRFAVDGVPLVNPLWLLKGLSNNVLGFATAALDARGINQNYCASAAGGLQAIGEAAWAVAEGRADIIIAGGADSAVNLEHLTGFGRLDMLSPSAAVRPFDVHRDGFVPGEGAAFFALESEAHAQARGRTPLARVVGYGSTSAATRIFSENPDRVESALRRALESAGWSRKEVHGIYAHGNGTRVLDETEARAIHAVFGDRCPPITADKGQIGHAVAAAGPISTAAALECARQGRWPAIHGLEKPDPLTHELDLVHINPRGMHIHRFLVHAAGLGGQSAVIALEVPA